LGSRLHRAGHRIRLNKELQVTHLKRYTLAGLIRSDVIGRAIPWTRIMLDSRLIRNDLNTRAHNVASVPVSFLLLATLALPRLWLPLGLPLALVFLALNRGFLAFTWRERGFIFLAGATMMCWLGYLYSGVGAFIGLIGYIRDSSIGYIRDSSIGYIRDSFRKEVPAKPQLSAPDDPVEVLGNVNEAHLQTLLRPPT
jgi:hypothetical protein